MKTGPAVAEILKREGVEYLFAYPVNHLIEHCAALDIRPIIVRQERIGLHMADAMSRLTKGRKMGVFCMQSGPGSENAYGGVAQAYGESVPLLVIPAGYPRRIAHVPPNFNSTLTMAHVAKHCEPVTSGQDIANIIFGNTLSADGTVALAGYSISDDGNLMAYGIAASGSDWNEWKVRDVRTGDRKSTRLNSSHVSESRMPSSA